MDLNLIETTPDGQYIESLKHDLSSGAITQEFDQAGAQQTGEMLIGMFAEGAEVTGLSLSLGDGGEQNCLIRAHVKKIKKLFLKMLH